MNRSIQKIISLLEKETTERLQQEAKTREELLKKEFDGERNVLTTRIKSLEETVKQQNEQIIRLSQRLGLTKNNDPEKIEQDLMRIIPREKWITFPFRLILHGRKICKAKNPECHQCILRNLCLFK